MALVTRRYVSIVTSTAQLAASVGPTCSVIGNYPTAAIDIQVDDAIPGEIDTLNEFMAKKGFAPIPAGVGVTLRVFPVAADPPAEPDRIIVYAMSVLGVVTLFARDNLGVIHPIT